MSGVEVVQHVRRFAPDTLIATQVEGTVPRDMLAAGASAVFSRRIPPALIAEQVAQYLRAQADEPLVLT